MAKAKKNSTPPTPPTPPTVGDLIIHYLELEGVKYVFGIPGGGLMNLLVNFKNSRSKIKYIICRQETGAAFIADGYYRATGKIGMVAVTSGPGATNALTGIMNAQADGSAVMLISGEIDQKFYGMGYLQEGIDTSLNVNDIYAAATGYSVMISSSTDAETIVKQAFRTALSLPRQAVHLGLPLNVTLEPLPGPVMSSSTNAYRTNPKGAPIEEVKEAMSSLLACKRPLLFLGNGCRHVLRDSDTYKNLLRFVETYSIPVMTTADGKGIFPESHEMSLRVYGMADCMWPYQYFTAKTPTYDGIMIIGSELGELSTNCWLPILKPQGKNATFIQVDINQKIIARSFEVTQGVVGEADAFINDLARLIPSFPANKKSVSERKAFIAAIKKQSPFADPASYNSNSNPIEPASIMRVLQNSLPKNSKIFIDCANCVGWSVHYLVVDPPASIFTSLSMGPMGFGVGSVIGGKIGCPDDTCICITGDAAFMMQGSEVSTAHHHKVGAIWLILFDNNLGMVSQGMDHFAPDTKKPGIWQELYELGNPDLELFAKGLGADAYTINSPKELEKIMPKVLTRANKDKVPQVIIANINKKLVPPYYNPIYGPPKPPGFNLKKPK
ncbi:MAG TPA: thiamine pyrophosphate-binding protein [Chitinophagaceae bacterium]|nr:thiamine pyrophosphate-binding protein [Chitinophagaceae bacterium]